MWKQKCEEINLLFESTQNTSYSLVVNFWGFPKPILWFNIIFAFIWISIYHSVLEYIFLNPVYIKLLIIWWNYLYIKKKLISKSVLWKLNVVERIWLINHKIKFFLNIRKISGGAFIELFFKCYTKSSVLWWPQNY